MQESSLGLFSLAIIVFSIVASNAMCVVVS